MRKKEILIAITAFLLGVGIMYVYSRNELDTNKTFTRRIIDNSINSIEASNVLVNTCSNAYKEFGTCVLDLKSCNLEESKKKLQILNKQKEQAEEQIRSVTKDMDSLIFRLGK